MFSVRLKELRSSRNLTQAELARDLHISLGAIGNWESNTRKPDTDTIQKIAEYFDVSVDYLLGRTEEKKPSAEIISEELDENVLVIRGRDGRYIRKKLTDEEIQSLEILLKSLPDVSDDV